MHEVRIYTDGACKGNPGPGGWGALLISGDRRREIFGGEPVTTNNRMELLAAIQGLQALKQPCKVLMHVDSKYVLQGITEWLPGWKANGWVGRKGPIKNVDLWKLLDRATAPHEIQWQWVKGHNGHPGNERADELANAGVPGRNGHG